jgi:hypothetical protein
MRSIGRLNLKSQQCGQSTDAARKWCIRDRIAAAFLDR